MTGCGSSVRGPFARILSAAAGKAAELGRGEDGVALMMTLATFMFMYVMCMGVYAVGTAVREKMQLQNAADAAAYSAAVVQADTISRIATINRAMSWTYVQMTRRQMDYIVHRWLGRIKDVYSADLAVGRKWNKLSLLPCDKGHHGVGPKSDTYWCGIDENRIGQVWMNGLPPDFDEVPIVGDIVSQARDIPGMGEVGLGRAVPMSDVESRVKAFESAYLKTMIPLSGDYISVSDNDLGRQIDMDKANIAAMNVAEMHLVYALKGRIEKVIPDILKANLPERDVDGDRVVYRIEQAESPFTYFRHLNNTKKDELLFCSFGGYGGEDYAAPFKIFRGEQRNGMTLTWQGALADPENMIAHSLIEKLGDVTHLNAMDGTDRWFVRGDGNRRAKDDDFGIQRSYKHWAEDVIGDTLRLHNSKYIKIKVGSRGTFCLPPSDLNFNGDDNSPSSILKYKSVLDSALDQKEYGLPSIGLYAQWQWYSMLWSCYPVYIPFPPWVYWVHRSVSPSLFMCHHNSWDLRITNGKDCIYLPGKVVGCWWPSYRLKVKHGIPHRKTAWHQTAHGDTTDFGIPGFRGYTRVYGDDAAIYNDRYVGEKCMPMLISPLYFGELGTITVGVARKNENVWTRFIPKVAKVGRGIFEAFEPFVKWSWAFSSAKAGYKEPPPGEWNPNSDDYKSVSNPKGEKYSNAYVVDWHGFNKDDNNWNLCQSDWDAVFVPVSKAKSWAIGRVWLDADGLGFNSDSFAKFAHPASPKYFMDKNYMNNWMLASNEWKPLKDGGEKLPDKAWKEIAAPPGMNSDFRSEEEKSRDKKDEDGDGNLDWASIPSIMKH